MNYSANDRQVGGDHYRTSVQHWDLAVRYNLRYLEGQVTKYTTRWSKKNGLQDLDKAIHFLEKLLEVRGVSTADMHSVATPYRGMTSADESFLHQYASANHLGAEEGAVVALIVSYTVTEICDQGVWMDDRDAALVTAHRLLSHVRGQFVASQLKSPPHKDADLLGTPVLEADAGDATPRYVNQD